jgi:FlaA1/EpsC-like NDP-sugar epimerase
MVVTLFSSTMSTVRTWLRAWVPTRESVVTAGALSLVFGATYLAAFFVRSELLLRPSDAAMIVRTLTWVVLGKLALFYLRGICHRPLRALRFDDLSLLVRTTTTALLIFVAVNFYFPQLIRGWVQIPRTVLLLDWAFTLLAVGGLQAAARSIYEEIVPANPVGHQRSALIIDASPAGRDVAARLSVPGPKGFFISGLLDDTPRDKPPGGLRIIGTIDNAAPCADRLRVTDVIVRQGSVFGTRLREICEACAAVRVRVSVAEPVPAAVDEVGATVPVHLRGVELRDLISHPERHATAYEPTLRSWVAGSTILVTGAGGSIGAEICRQLVRLGPARILLVDQAEWGLFEIHRELMEAAGHRTADDRTVAVEPILADIADVAGMKRLFSEWKPAVVIHAAAYKHVPMLESHACEAIRNNILATASLAEIAVGHGVRSFIALSTDKAVRPSCVMGASKLVAERLLQSLAGTSATRFVIVRFGNVLGSSGSAVPIFTRQLVERRDVTVTHPDVSRYFMTGPEAAGMALLAGALAESGGTFVLDMGEPLPVVELVRSLAFVLHVPRHALSIRFTGLRPGEKLAEELFHGDETPEPLENAPVYRVQRPAVPRGTVDRWLSDLRTAADAGANARAREFLLAIVADDTSTEGRHGDRPPYTSEGGPS